MSTFTYKLIATIFMFIDHLAASFQISNNEILSYEVLSLMRSMGRVSLPIFAYFLVVSYGKTRDIHKYISRLHLGAIISQVPFSLLFNQSFYGNQSINLFSYQYENLIFTGLIIVSYFLFITKRKFTKDLFIVSFAWLLAPLNIVYKGVYIFNPTDLNIFYEFGLSIIVIYLLDEINQEFRITSLKNIFAIMVIIGLSFYIDRVGNYATEIADLKRLLDLNLKKRFYELVRLDKFIQTIDDPLIRLIAIYRFEKDMSWTQIAIALGGNNKAESVRKKIYRYLKKI